MNDLIFGMLCVKCTNYFPILRCCPRPNGRHTIDLTAKQFDFVVICTPLLPMHHEVKLYFRAIHISIIVHDHGFSPTTVHNGK